MSTIQGAPLDQLMQDFKGPLSERCEALEVQRRDLIDAHRAALTELDSEIARYRRILRAAFPEEFNPDRKAEREATKRPGADTTYTIPPDKLDAVRRFIFRHLKENDAVTQVEVRLQLGYDSGTVSTAFRLLREENVIRQSGQVGNKKFYKLTKDAAEALIANSVLGARPESEES